MILYIDFASIKTHIKSTYFIKDILILRYLTTVQHFYGDFSR